MPKPKRLKNRKQPKGNTFNKKVKKVLYKLSETKRYDQYAGTTGAPNYVPLAGSGTYPLTGVPLGSNDYQRIGNKIIPLSLKVNITMWAQASYNQVRVIVFRYDPTVISGTVSVVPLMSDLLEDSDSTGATRFLSGYKLETARMYKVYYDRVHTVDINQQNTVKTLRINITKGLPKEIQFTYGGSTQVSAGKGAMYVNLIPLYDGGNASGRGVPWNLSSQLLYKDI